MTYGSLWMAIALVAGAVSAQEPAPPKPAESDPPAPQVVRPQANDAEREMIELFGRVERTLGAIDRLLQQAANSAPAPAAGAGETAGGLAGRLRDAQASGVEVQKAIDRILELAAQQRPQSSSGGSPRGDQQNQGGSPLDGQGEQSTGRESTPSMPEQGGEEQPGGEAKQPGPGGEKPSEPKDGRGDPKGPLDSKTPPHQVPGGDPRAGEKGAGSSSADGQDRWGDLPVHARDVFRNEGGRDMPPLYREWIDAYYRRLNQKP